VTDSALERLREAGVLSSLDRHFAVCIAALAGEVRPDVLLAAALASRQVASGHVCLDLPRLVEGALSALAPIAVARLDEWRWPELAGWLAELASSPLVDAEARVDLATPLVLDDAGRLYLRRYWLHQQGLAEAIRSRVAAGPSQLPVDRVRLEQGLERLFPDPDDALQREAAATAVTSRFCVVSGGPGTGKTSTVVKILALLVEQALGAGGPAPRIRLLAPTGKAAAALAGAIQRSLTDLACSDEAKACIPESAATLHRALRPLPGSNTRFRHDARDPIAADVVIVDEASMVDLALMARLFEALPTDARVILLGDRDQLASVEAGAVLGDIAGAGAGPAVGAAQASTIRGHVVQLTRSHRYRTDSGIAALARAINEGDADAALAVLDDPTRPDVSRVSPPLAGGLGESLEADVLAGYADFLAARDPAVRLRALDRFRVLCAHRLGPHGVEALNRAIEALLARRGGLPVRGAFYAGRPILVLRNDPQLEIYNGDVGVLMPRPAELGAGHLGAFFRAGGAGAEPRWLSPLRLPPFETVFAMSVHKSQGSEFDAVALVLPDRTSRVVTRELLYTAVSRARERVVVHARPELLREAIGRRVERASGLSEALWA